jgi:hypothetical protein
MGLGIDGAGRRATSPPEGLELRVLALLFEALFAAVVLLSGGETLAGFWLEAFSTAVLASPTTAEPSLAPFVVAALAGAAVDSAAARVTLAGGVAVAAAVFSGASAVRLSASAPPITVAVITPSAMPK